MRGREVGSLWAKSSRTMHDENSLTHPYCSKTDSATSKGKWMEASRCFRSKAEWYAPVPQSASGVGSKRQRWPCNCSDISSGPEVPDWWLAFVISTGGILCSTRSHSSVKLCVVLQQTRPGDWLPTCRWGLLFWAQWRDWLASRPMQLLIQRALK